MSSIGGLDPLADAYNLIGAQEMTGPNPYLEYQGQIPMAGYQGAPVNAATGQPIQSYQSILAALNAANPGTTLNTPPPQQQAASPTINEGGMLPSGENYGSSSPTYIPSTLNYQPQQAQQPVNQQPAAAQPNNAANQRQAYLQALANPGPLPTYGAQMQPGATQTGAPQPSVLQAFLAAHPSGGTSIPGGYSNQSFFSTLNNLRAAKGATT